MPSLGYAGPFAGALVLLVLTYLVYYRFLHPVAHFPGPFLCSISNLWKLWAVATDRMPDEVVKLHDRYGPIVRIGPNDLSFNSPDAVSDIYRRGWQKGEFYRGFKRPEPGLFNMTDEKLHTQRKRMFGLGMSMASLRSMEGIIDSRYAILRRQMDRFATTGEIFDLRKYITYCIVDILGELAFGHSFENQESEDPAKIPPVSEALFGGCVAGQMPWAADALIYLGNRFPVPEVQKLLASVNLMVPIAAKNIRLREENKLDREDILGKLMAAREEKSGQALTESEIITEAITLIVGGTHTTGNTLHILLANLSRNQEYLRRVVEEIDKSLPPLEPTQAAYSMNALEEKLDFTLAAIRESHRKDPVGTFNMPRVVPDGGARIAGDYIPAGAQVSLNIHAFHHNPDFWGNDHNQYDPDRFYDTRAKELKEFVIPFSVGKRACAGQNLANANILKMTTTLLRAYEFEFVNADEPMKVVCHGDSDLRTPLSVRCKMRGEAFKGYAEDAS